MHDSLHDGLEGVSFSLLRASMPVGFDAVPGSAAEPCIWMLLLKGDFNGSHISLLPEKALESVGYFRPTIVL